MHDFLTELAAFETDEAWVADGATDAVAWLAQELGLARPTARHWLEVARNLGTFPLISAELRAGRISIDQARPLCRLAAQDERFTVDNGPDDPDGPGSLPDPMATAEVEAELVDLAKHHTVTELQRLARRPRDITPSQENADHDNAEVETWWDEHGRFLHLSGRVPGVDGAIVELALNRLSVQEPRDPVTGQFDHPDQRMARALVQMASESLGSDGDSDRASVLVHVDYTALAGDGIGHVPAGPALSAETIRFLTCDGRRQLVVDGPDGAPIGVGRTTRTIPPWLARLVAERDKGCRFPGCRRTRWTQIHHINHWAHGGTTDLCNLVTLCVFHHRMLHRQGWRIEGNPSGTLTWIRPRGDLHLPLRLAEDDPDPAFLPRGLVGFNLEQRLDTIDSAFAGHWGPIPPRST